MRGETTSADDIDGTASRLGGLPVLARRFGFGLIALFILLAPAAGQVFGVHHLLLREWVMYSGVGVGIPQGEFLIWRDDTVVARLSPLDALDLPAYPRVIHYTFEHRILSNEDFAGFATRLCAERGTYGGDRVSFEGVIGTREGWQAASQDNLCERSLRRAAASRSGEEMRGVE